MHDDFDGQRGVFLNTETGDTLPIGMAGSGHDGYVDDDDDDFDLDDPAWVRLEDDTRDWLDLDAFVRTRRENSAERSRLAEAIEGRGAFGRFRRVTDDLGLTAHWFDFRDDRRLGRTRQLLADLELRAVDPR